MTFHRLFRNNTQDSFCLILKTALRIIQINGNNFAGNQSKIPILLYHALFDKEANTEKYAISKAEFEKQINIFQKKGLRAYLLPISLKLKVSQEQERCHSSYL